VRFHFSAFNHSESGRQTLLDMYLWLQAGLEELGHHVSFSETELDPSAVNVVWECFMGGDGERLRDSGLRYGVIVTEFVDGGGFNFGNPMAVGPSRRDASYHRRWLGFNAAMDGAAFAWSMVESNVELLAHQRPAAFVELGYSSRLLPKQDVSPDLTFSFTGLVTPYRREILERLSARARVVWQPHLFPLAERDTIVQRTCWNLSINKTGDWQMPSPTRLGRVLHASRGIVLDRTPQRTRQSSLVTAPPDGMEFVEWALASLGRDWRAEGREALERYREELPMRQITEALLEKTVASRGPSL
jgi:hypothetical protein